MASLSASSGTRFVAALVVGALAAFCLPPAAAATEHPWLIPPVDAPIKRGFDLPEGQKGPGNRGLDYAVTEGTSARAAGDGRVTFAGHVAGTLAITIDHGDFLETTYTGMDELYVRPGDDVDQGHWLGTTGAELHFGVKLRDIYVDPQDYLGPIDMGDAIHLIPIEDKGSWGDMVEQMMDVDFEGLDTIGCTERDLLRTPSHRRAPSDNIAVMIGGINGTWSEGSKRSVAGTADDLGYEPESSYVVSYSLDQGGYSRIDTFSDLRSSAQKLDALLQRIALEHPGSDVDILAHSQGGLVARYLLETAATSWNVRRPRVDHLVTFGTPHQGAPLGDVSEELGGLWSGKLVKDGLRNAHRTGRAMELPGWAKLPYTPLPAMELTANFLGRRATLVVPDPYARSIQQMEPGSEFLRNLATDDIVYGTRVLALQDKLDLIVPADHARWPGEANRGVDGDSSKLLGGLNRHGAIVDNPEALAMTHAWLRGARLPCLEERDEAVWEWGERIAKGTALVPLAWQLGEDATLTLFLRGRGSSVKVVVREGTTIWRLFRARGLRGVVSYGTDKVTYLIRNPEEVLEWLADQTIEAQIKDAVREVLEALVDAEE